MSTSAIKTIVEHNRMIDRTPLTTPRVAPERSSRQIEKDSFRRLTSLPDGWPGSLRSSASREVTGQGQGWDFNPAPALSSAIARAGTLSPTRSLQTPHVASPLQRRYGETCAAKSSMKRSLHEPAWQTRSRELTARAASHAPSRKGARSAAPKVPSIDEHPS
jgi:hypothetical protein